MRKIIVSAKNRLAEIFFLIRSFKFRIEAREYGLDSWHVRGELGFEYQRLAVSLANSLSKRGSIIEVGCGTGKILRQVNFERKLGIDQDRKALEFARIKDSESLYLFGNYGTVSLPECFRRKLDCIVMLNWIHNVSPHLVRQGLLQITKQLLESNDVFLITEGVENYKHFHDAAFWSNVGRVLSSVRVGNRHIFLVHLNPLEISTVD